MTRARALFEDGVGCALLAILCAAIGFTCLFLDPEVKPFSPLAPAHVARCAGRQPEPPFLPAAPAHSQPDQIATLLAKN